MAGLVREPRDSISISRRRHGHVRKAISSARRREYFLRRLPVEMVRDCSASCSPLPRQVQPLLQPSPAPMTPPNTWVSSLDTPAAHYSDCIRMERTSSGTSIISDKSFEPRHNNTFTYCDEEAARKVETHFKRLSPNDQQERKLRSLIRSLINNTYPVDNTALDTVLSLADSVFFGGVLFRRVRWEWSDPSQKRFETELIGTTALRPAAQGGYETLIVLSDPILKHPDYDRRLLLSAFLHELVHCYLFIQCGFVARLHGGHTDGFHTIVHIIDKWAGSGYLRLCDMKANLDHFLNYRGRVMDLNAEAIRDHRHDGCNQSPGPQRDYLENVGLNPGWA